MSANKLIKEWGLESAKTILSNNSDAQEFKIHLNGGFWKNPSVVIVKDLNRLVESHELVEKLGGIDTMRIMQKQMVLNSLKGGMNISFDGEFVGTFSYDQLEQAIADVESCQ